MSSSFYWAMRLMPVARRQAMFALYDYCRVLDDVADGPQPAEVKRARLNAFRHDVAALYSGGTVVAPEVAGLAPAVERFTLQRPELEALIDGMEMDVDGPVVAPSLDRLRLYCRRVAGAVGMLAVRIFGRSEAETLAVALGEALQFTNILRDVAEDAGLGRLYLPAELLSEAGIADHRPATVVRHPALPRVCDALATMAEGRFGEAEAEITRLGRRGLWPAMVMAATYRAQLSRLRAHGWHPGPPPRVGRLEKLAIALRTVLTAAMQAAIDIARRVVVTAP
jgi:phytoene synthase